MRINPYLAFCRVMLGLTTWERIRTSWERGIDPFIFEHKTICMVLDLDRRLIQDWRNRDRNEPVYININGAVRAVNPGVHTVTIARAPETRIGLNEYTNDFEPVIYDTVDIPVNRTTCAVNPDDAPELDF